MLNITVFKYGVSQTQTKGERASWFFSKYVANRRQYVSLSPRVSIVNGYIIRVFRFGKADLAFIIPVILLFITSFLFIGFYASLVGVSTGNGKCMEHRLQCFWA